jgi:peptide/nickel transport system permease protein
MTEHTSEPVVPAKEQPEIAGVVVDTNGSKEGSPKGPVATTGKKKQNNTLGLVAALKRAARTPGGFVGICLIVVMLILGLGAEWWAPFDPAYNDFSKILKGPGEGGLLGSDTLGRDLFSRILYGIKASITVGVAAVALAFCIGVPSG